MPEIWNVKRVSLVEAHLLAAKLKCSPMMAKLLLARGIKKEQAKTFLVEGGPFHSPLELSNLKPALERILRAVKNREKIVIYGDYDVDGITATTLLMDLFQRSGSNVSYYLPERLTEGYGLNLEAIKMLRDKGTDLLITVDCGITSLDIANEAKKLGLDLIITDHHTPLEKLPVACAVINPHLDQYPAPLCGAGVAYKLAQALAQEAPASFQLTPLQIQMAALGTIADIVDLVDENRRIVKQGLMSMNKEPIPGILALKEAARLSDRPIDAAKVAFVLAPRINAAGRLGTARKGVDLFLSKTFKEALPIAINLDELNANRKSIEDDILQEALLQAEKQLHHKALVLAGENWHSGVIGIVASRLVEKHYRPTIVIELKGNECHGSCRSIENFNIYNALEANKAYLLKFGGHPMAAGLSICQTKIAEFQEAFLDYADKTISAEDLYPRVYIDASVNSPITIPLIEELALLEPCGAGNPSPLFVIKEARLENAYLVGVDKKHLKLQLAKNDLQYSGIAFNMASCLEEIEKSPDIDVVFVPEVNEYQGQRSVSLQVKNLRPQVKEWESFGEEDIWQFWESLPSGELKELAQSYLKGNKTICLPTIGLAHNMKRLQTELLLDSQVEFRLEKRDLYIPVKKPELLKDKTIGLLINSEPVLWAFLAEGAKECTLSYLPANYWWWRLFWEVAQASKTVSLSIDKTSFQNIKRQHKLAFPSQENLRRIYLFLKKSADKMIWRGTYKQTAIDMENRFGQPFTEETIKKAFIIFTEIGLMEYLGSNKEGVGYLIKVPKRKLDLQKSLSYNEGIFLTKELELYASEVASTACIK